VYKIVRDQIVDNFVHHGLKWDGQTVTSFEYVKRIIQSEELMRLYKNKHWMIPFTLTTKSVCNGALYSHDKLYHRLRKWANSLGCCAFDFPQLAKTPNEGLAVNNIIKIISSNFKAVYEPIQHIAAERFGMSIRKGKKDEKGFIYIPIKFSSRVNPTNMNTYLKVCKSSHPQLVNCTKQGDILLYGHKSQGH